MTAGRDLQVRFRTTPSERQWFHQVARAHGLTLSELIRQAIAVEGAKAGIPVPAATAN